MIIDEHAMPKLVWLVNSLQERPLYKSFSGPVKYKSKTTNETSEISLETILQGVQEGEIETVDEFENQMKLWFQLKGTRQPLIYKFALSELQRLFNKYYGYVEATLKRDMWTRKTEILNGELETLFKKAPPCVVFPAEKAPLERSKLLFAVNTINKVVAPMDVYQVYQILRKDPSGLDLTQEDVTVDLETLSPAIQHEIYEFLVGRFPPPAQAPQ